MLLKRDGPLQQQRDAEAQQQLEAHREEGIGERDVDGVPELRVGEEVDVVVEPDEALHLRAGSSGSAASSNRRR